MSPSLAASLRSDGALSEVAGEEDGSDRLAKAMLKKENEILETVLYKEKVSAAIARSASESPVRLPNQTGSPRRGEKALMAAETSKSPV